MTPPRRRRARDGRAAARSATRTSPSSTSRCHPTWRRQGIGTALFDAGLQIARDAGRQVVQSDSAHSPSSRRPGPARIESPTGSGRIPTDDDATRFALARGFTLEQVVRHSVLDLPVAESVLDPLRRDPGPDYRVHLMQDAYAERVARPAGRPQDADEHRRPAGGLDLTEEPWDADRVRADAADLRRARPRAS